MYRLDRRRRSLVVKCLVEGMTLRGTARATGVARMTIERLVRDIGFVCARYHYEHVRGLASRHIECDEHWAFVYAKEANARRARNAPAGAGDVWTWIALDADAKLAITWLVGQREQADCTTFIRDLHDRLVGPPLIPQITTDGLRLYRIAIEEVFGDDAVYTQLLKTYAGDDDPERRGARYSATRCIRSIPRRVIGDPALEFVSTSFVERQNLTVRMDMARNHRLTLGFSKSVEMHAHQTAIIYFNYNFVRIHGSLGVTPAMAAGVTDRLWDVEDLVDLLIEEERREERTFSAPRPPGQNHLMALVTT